jgi:hypothetical protein
MKLIIMANIPTDQGLLTFNFEVGLMSRNKLLGSSA